MRIDPNQERAIQAAFDGYVKPSPNPVGDYTAEALLRRAVLNCRDRLSRKGQKHTRWVAVMDTFALGSTYAAQLCSWAGVDPDELVKR